MFLLLLLAQPATAQDTIEYSGTDAWTPSEDLLSLLGEDRELSEAGQIDLGAALEVDLRTDIDCGAIKFTSDWEATASQLSELPGQLTNVGETVLAAAPMLTLCYMSPQLCAELKNLSLRIEEDWSFQAELCESIDRYIDEQAEYGERLKGRAEADAKRACWEERVAEGEELRDAVAWCETGSEPARVLDIAKGFLGTVESAGTQRVLEAALDAVNTELSRDPEFYALLRAVSGDAELHHDGTVVPLLPEYGSQTAAGLAEDMAYRSKLYACSLTRLARVVDGSHVTEEAKILSGTDDPGERFWWRRLIATYDTHLSMRDYDNLAVLTAGDFYPVCHALGMSLARQTAREIAAETRSEVALVEQNPALGEVGRAKTEAIRDWMATLDRQWVDDSIRSVKEMRVLLEELAERTRAEQRAGAGSLSRGEQRNRALWGEGACNSFLTCGGGD